MLPARFPNLLVNGAGGIAVGLATNIPPHNLREAINATVALMENPDISLDGLMARLPCPDFPTGGVLLNTEEIRKAYGEVEDMAVEHLVSMLPPELRDEYREIMTMGGQADQALKPLVKAADKISAVIKCVEERRSGNRDFSKAEQTITKAIQEMGLPEADYFMEEFLPSYGLTIEEQDYTREAGLKFSESSQMVFSKVLPEKSRRRKKS